MSKVYNSLMLMSMLLMNSENLGIEKTLPKPDIKEYIKKDYILSFGYGKICFSFETEFGIVKIYADKLKTAQKALKKLNNINNAIKFENKLLTK